MAICLFQVPAVLAQDADVDNSKPPAKANSRPEAVPEKVPEPYDGVPVAGMTKCVSLRTAKGTIILEMFPETAPLSVRNFLNLVAIGALKNTTFSRVVPGFVIQGGNLYSNPDITYEMSVRAQKTIPDEPNLVRHERGIVSMARTDEPDSATTDFFILVSDAPSLDNKFASFGRVVEGMDAVDAINKMPVEGEKPKEPVVIDSTEVVECSFQPMPAPKINERAQFGLRGRVRLVREISTETNRSKRKNTNTALSAGSILEFGEAGDLVKLTILAADASKASIVTSETMVPAPGKPKIKKRYQKDSDGNLISETVFTDLSNNEKAYESYNVKKELVRKGKIKTDESGRVLEDSYEIYSKDNSVAGKVIIRKTYDAYGFTSTETELDATGNPISYRRFDYREFDDQGNWTKRLVYGSEEGKEPVRSSERTIEYYKEDGS